VLFIIFHPILRTNVRHYSFNTLAQTMPLWGNWSNCCGYVFTKRKSWSPLLHGDQYFFVLLDKYFIILYSLVFSSLWVYYVIYLLASINPIDKVVISHLPTGRKSWPLCKWLWICHLRCGPRGWRSFSKYHTWDWCSASIDSQEGKLPGKINWIHIVGFSENWTLQVACI